LGAATSPGWSPGRSRLFLNRPVSRALQPRFFCRAGSWSAAISEALYASTGCSVAWIWPRRSAAVLYCQAKGTSRCIFVPRCIAARSGASDFRDAAIAGPPTGESAMPLSTDIKGQVVRVTSGAAEAALSTADSDFAKQDQVGPASGLLRQMDESPPPSRTGTPYALRFPEAEACPRTNLNTAERMAESTFPPLKGLTIKPCTPKSVARWSVAAVMDAEMPKISALGNSARRVSMVDHGSESPSSKVMKTSCGDRRASFDGVDDATLLSPTTSWPPAAKIDRSEPRAIALASRITALSMSFSLYLAMA
jgi:hypothetical protein